MQKTIKQSCFLLSSDNYQNANIRKYLYDSLNLSFNKVYSVGDFKTGVCQHEIFWKRASKRNNPFMEVILFLRLIFIFLKYNPSHVISFSPKVNIYAGLISRLLSIKHIPVISGLGRDQNKFESNNSFHQILLKISLSSANAIVTMNKSNYEFFKKILTPHHLLLIPSEAFDHKRCEQLKKDYNDIQVFYISRIVPEKGVLLLLEAFNEILKEHPKAVLNIAGYMALREGSYEKNIFNEFIKKENINYHGVVTNEFKQNLFDQSTIFAFPSAYGEGLPMVLLESQASKCLTVTTKLPGCSDSLAPEMKKYLCSYSKKSLLRSMLIAINTPSEEAELICEEAKSWVLKNHNSKKVLRLYMDFFRTSGFID